ncbi:hypothetical protein [Pelagicoccus sp. SDUM812005]|uniref:hypothetical protein n=1 Tax=Pelagicoccus sp. SDUM812005 TaxID=3041257 RepID=UPI00281074C5|nr:hypothetical protein [Pelagicoccus sp. SDUM812005]MDQ8182205.1 hypothetical protein [Pelagicoccus sp. SDUM812005]
MKDGEPTKLVDGITLLEILFDEASRPSLRWLRKMQAEKRVPYIKIGRLVRFDPKEVRTCLSKSGEQNP